MLYALAVALVTTIAGFLWLLDRRDQRERDERQALLQRIQSPEAAVAQHAQQYTLPSPVDAMPMTDEEIAERQSLLSYVTQMEANGGPLA